MSRHCSCVECSASRCSTPATTSANWLWSSVHMSTRPACDLWASPHWRAALDERARRLRHMRPRVRCPPDEPHHAANAARQRLQLRRHHGSRRQSPTPTRTHTRRNRTPTRPTCITSTPRRLDYHPTHVMAPNPTMEKNRRSCHALRHAAVFGTAMACEGFDGCRPLARVSPPVEARQCLMLPSACPVPTPLLPLPRAGLVAE
jgi:hypothetical protein